MKEITFYLDFVSPYAYLAFEKLPEALQGLSYAVDYKPVLFAGLLKHHGQLGPAEIDEPTGEQAAERPFPCRCRLRIRSTRCRCCGWRWPAARKARPIATSAKRFFAMSGAVAPMPVTLSVCRCSSNRSPRREIRPATT